ncbi:MAG: BamA/TamA family outer membrane protein [Chitinophagales bacterium]|nr:BamA/TamA family outer membrane protein [Chitinophagales bacterium]
MRWNWLLIPWWMTGHAMAQTDLPVTTDSSRYDGRLVVAPLIYYQPETSWAFGGGALYTLTDRLQPDNNPGLLKLLGVYTLENQVQSELGGDLYFEHNTWYLSFNFTYYRFPGLFFGIGNENPAENAESYTVSKPYGRINLVRDVGHHISAGFKTFYEYTRLVEIAEGGLLDTEDVSGETGGHNTGIGPWLVADTRNDIFYPTRGWKADLSAVWHDHLLGSDFEYTEVRMEFSAFHAVWKQQVLAWNLLADLHPGNPPFNRMAMMGGQFYMRGNFEGRLRDKHLLTTQMEYRVPVWRFIGVTGFGGIGEVGDALSSFTWSGLRYSYGAGLRLELMPDSNLKLRVDYGFGYDGDRGLYVQFNEAF